MGRRPLVAVLVAASLLAPVAGSAAGSRTVVYFYKGAALTKVAVPAPGGTGGAKGALAALLAGPPPGFTTAVPRGVTVLGLRTVNGTATATFSRALGEPTRSAQGQIVATLSRFPGVKHVLVTEQGRGVVTLRRGDGLALLAGARLSDYVDLTPNAAIFVAAPARDSTVSSPVKVSGTADTFEAAFQLQVVTGGRVVHTKTVNATAGTGTRGTWSATIAAPRGDVTLVLFEPSAKDGTPIHTTRVQLHVR